MAISPTPTLLSPPPFPASNHVDRPTQKALRPLYTSLQREQLRSSTQVALATAKALRRVISGARYTTMNELSDAVRLTGAWLQEARRGEQAITNITLRTLHLLAEESGALLEQAGTASQGPSRSYSTLSTAPPTPAATAAAPSTASTSYLNASPSASPLASPPAQQRPPIRPGLGSRLDSNFFAHDSTFSISDLVAAGQNANTPALGGLDSGFPSGASTPALHMRDVSFSSLAVRDDVVPEGNEDSDQDDDEDEDSEGDEDEDDDAAADEVMASSTNSLHTPSRTTNAFHLKPLLIQAVQELIDELESTRTNIARDARDHIHTGEIVLTLGHSLTVETFLKQAARDRHFTLVVADSGVSTSASLYNAALPRKKIKILSIPHSSIFTVLPRVTKVILSPHAVLANGGLLAPPGSMAASTAAKVHSTPVLALAGLHKVCGDWQWVGIASSCSGSGGPTSSRMLSENDLQVQRQQHGRDSSNSTMAATSLATPASSLLSSSSSTQSTTLAGDTCTKAPQSVLSHPPTDVQEVISHEWDYVEPHLVDVLVTNTGEYPASYVYRLIAENFAR